MTPGQCRAARALLGWSQKTLAIRAHLALVTVADFERGARNPIYNNLKAMQSVFEQAEIRFLYGGVVWAFLIELQGAKRE